MSTTTHLRHGLDLYALGKPAPRRWKLLAGVLTVWHALAEGFAAARHYQELTARGVSHDEAASQVFFAHYAGK
jgi:hypothetical protein